MVRLKCRYIVCKLEFRNRTTLPDLTEDVVYKSIFKELKALHGMHALGSMQSNVGLSVKYLNKNTNVIMIRCGRGVYKLVQSSLPFVKSLGKVEMFFNTLHVAGTVRSCLKFLVRYHKTVLPSLLAECKSQEEKEKVKKLIVESCRESSKGIGFLKKMSTTTAAT